MSEIIHRQLACGIEFAGEVLPSRHAVCTEIRFFGGLAYEPSEHLGLAHVLIETIDKGTEHRDAKGVSDAFDELGARHSAWSGREAVGFNLTSLPEFVEQTIDLQAEMIRQPVFPQDLLDVALDLSHQELHALEDDPRELADKYLSMQAYGDPIGRHALGTHETLDSIQRQTILGYWSRHLQPGRMQVAMAGAFDPDRIIAKLEAAFGGFGDPTPAGRDQFKVDFEPVRTHYHKELEQEHINICYPAAPILSETYPTQRVLIGILAGGMSGRLFTEIREKQGLVYWIGAWTDYPRGAGFIQLGAGTSSDRCDKTYESLFREIDRLADDVQQTELDRAIIGIVARTETRGDMTSARCSRLADDLFHYGEPVSVEEKIRQVKAVSVDDLHAYLDQYPRDQLSVVTLGPKELAAG